MQAPRIHGVCKLLKDLLEKISPDQDLTCTAHTRIDYGNATGQDQADRDPHFAREPAQAICHMDVSEEQFMRKFLENRTTDGSRDHDPHFVQAYAVEMHMDMTQRQLHARIYKQKTGQRIEHPDQAPA